MVFIELQIFLKTNIAIGYNILLKFIMYLFAIISNIIVYNEVELCSQFVFSLCTFNHTWTGTDCDELGSNPVPFLCSLSNTAFVHFYLIFLLPHVLFNRE